MLEAKNFSLSRGGREILRDVSFQIRRGEYVTIVGPNGAGKTTLLKCFDRLIDGGDGELAICGMPREKYHQRDLARLIAYVPQADGRLIPFTVEQFLLMCRYPYFSPFAAVSKEDRRMVREAMDRTDTAQFADRILTTLKRRRAAEGVYRGRVGPRRVDLAARRADDFFGLRPAIGNSLAHGGGEPAVRRHDRLRHARFEPCRAGNRPRDRHQGRPRGVQRPAGGDHETRRCLQQIYGTSLLLVDHPQASMPMIVPRISTEALP